MPPASVCPSVVSGTETETYVTSTSNQNSFPVASTAAPDQMDSYSRCPSVDELEQRFPRARPYQRVLCSEANPKSELGIMKRITSLALLIVLLLVSSLDAQQPAEIRQVHSATIQSDANRLQTYSRFYFQGQYDSLAAVVRTDLASALAESHRWASISSAHLSAVLVASQPAQKEPVIIRFLVPPEGGIVAAPARLPGEDSLYEIFLSADEAARIESLWLSTQEELPLRGQIIKMAEAMLAPAATLLEAAAHPELLGDPPERPLHIHVRRVVLPHRRATLKVATRITSVEDQSAVRAKATLLQAELLRGNSRLSPCAISLVNDLSTLVNSSLSDQPGQGYNPAIRKNLVEALIAAIAARIASSVCEQETSASANGALATARAEAVKAVGDRFLVLAGSSGEPLTSSSELRNAPHSRWSVGLVGGGMLSRGGDANYVLADQVPQRNDLSGLVTAAVLHWHPVAYDPLRPDISWAERVSVFGGLVTTPSAGMATGASFRLFRGLGVQAAHVWLRAERLRDGFQAGEVVDGAAAPFELGLTTAFVFGISYDFK